MFNFRTTPLTRPNVPQQIFPARGTQIVTAPGSGRGFPQDDTPRFQPPASVIFPAGRHTFSHRFRANNPIHLQTSSFRAKRLHPIHLTPADRTDHGQNGLWLPSSGCRLHFSDARRADRDVATRQQTGVNLVLQTDHADIVGVDAEIARSPVEAGVRSPGELGVLKKFWWQYHHVHSGA